MHSTDREDTIVSSRKQLGTRPAPTAARPKPALWSHCRAVGVCARVRMFRTAVPINPGESVPVHGLRAPAAIPTHGEGQGQRQAPAAGRKPRCRFRRRSPGTVFFFLLHCWRQKAREKPLDVLPAGGRERHRQLANRGPRGFRRWWRRDGDAGGQVLQRARIRG